MAAVRPRPAGTRSAPHAPAPLVQAVRRPRASPVRAGRAFAALRTRNYRLYFCGQLVSVTGWSMQTLGQSWLVFKLTGSGIDLGGVVTAQFLPMLVFGSYGGMLADRYDKRRLIITTQVLGGGLALVLGLLTATGAVRLWMVYALALATGFVSSVDLPARQVFATDMVGPTLVSSAVSMNEVIINASRVFGPAIAGVVITRFGTTPCFFINAASFLPSIAALAMIRTADLHHRLRATPQRGQLMQGVRYALAAPLLRSLILMAAASAMVYNFGVSLPFMAERVLHSGAGGYGAMVAAFGIGALGGAYFAASDPHPNGRRVRTLAVLTGMVVIVSAAMPNLAFELAAMALTGVISIWFISLANAVTQLRTTPAMRGRVMGLWSMALPGSLPVSGPLVGWVAGLWGGREALAAGGAAVLVTTVAGWRALAADTPASSTPPADTTPLSTAAEDAPIGRTPQPSR
ncbi:MAG TPA: MFS transporter [Streptosporangiaceae bacterium]|nr:MFS transporter [Streptosporangiaceae bacterium]